MSTNFLKNLNGIFSATSTADAKELDCTEQINHFTYYQFAILPAICITLVFAMTKKRKNVLKGFMRGRPALIYPMDSLTRTSRLTYACAFGATAYLIYQIVLHRKYAIDTSGYSRAATSFVVLLSMIVYGLVYFPLFASQALGSMLGYGFGSLYVWMLTVVEIYRLATCVTTTRNMILLVFRGLPNILCLAFLSTMFPIRVFQSCRAGRYFFWKEDDSMIFNTLKDIRESYSGHHVIELLTKPPIKRRPADATLTARIQHLVMHLFQRFVYKRKKGFRYPARILSVVFVATLVVYTLTFEIMSIVPQLFDSLKDGVLSYMADTVGLDALPTDTEEIIAIRQALWALWWIFDITKISCMVANIVATIITLFNVLHTLSSYRANLLALYRGDHSHIPEASAYGHVTNCVNSIKYAGFQVGYIIWGYLLLTLILTLIAVCLAVVFTLMAHDFTDWLVVLLEYSWPVVLVAVIVAVVQIVLCKFVFLQENGKYQSLDNRHFYFNFTYFMFFYNIFLGLVSCVLRILKAMFVGLLFLSRLDNSTLPRKFEFIDPGFKAYVGYMHIETVHTHPVVIVFSRLMILALKQKRDRVDAVMDTAKAVNGDTDHNCPPPPPPPMSTKLDKASLNDQLSSKQQPEGLHKLVEEQEQRHRRSLAARCNWLVAYTLLNNPDIRITRKGYLQMLRRAKELGIRIPISDRRENVDLGELQRDIKEAEEGGGVGEERKEGELKDVQTTSASCDSKAVEGEGKGRRCRDEGAGGAGERKEKEGGREEKGGKARGLKQSSSVDSGQLTPVDA